MIFKLFKRIAVVLLAVSIVGSAGLGFDTSVAFGAAKTVKAKSVSLNHKTYTIKKGKTLKLKATIKPKNTTQKTIVWKTSNKKIATVKNGKIKAKKKGKVTITATVKGTKKKAKATIYVGTPVKKAVFPTTTVTLETGQVTTVAASLSPDNPTVKGITYSSSNPNVAAAGAGGVITAVSAGTAVITAKPKDEAGKSATLTVVVNNRIQNNSEVKPAPPEEPDEPVIDNLEDNIVDRGDLQHLSEQGTIEVSYGESGSVDFIDGSFTTEKVNSTDEAINLLDEKTNFLRGFNAGNSSVEEVVLEDKETETIETFYRFSPYYDGIPVIGSQVVLVTEADGTVSGLTSSFSRSLGSYEDDDYGQEYVNTNAEISTDEALQAAINALINEEDVQEYLSQSGSTEDAFIGEYVTYIEPRLVIYAADYNETPELAYEISLAVAYPDQGEDSEDLPAEDTEGAEDALMIPTISKTYYVLANTGEARTVISTKNNVEIWSDAPVRVKQISTIDSDHQLDVEKDGDVYRLVDNKRNITVRKTQQLFYYTPTGYHGEIAKSPVDNKAVYSLMNMEKTYDFYKNVLSRTSYDGNGAAIKVFYDMHDHRRTDTAGWDGEYKSFVIDKDAGCERGLDVLAHEFTHAVMESINGGLRGSEGSALNEAYADVMGNLIEGKKDGDGEWRLGEDTNVEKTSMTEEMKFFDFKSSNDAHVNARIFAHAAYLMMTDEATKHIPKETWAKVFYKSMYYLTSDASFLQTRRAVLCAANRCGFTAEEQKAIRDAFAWLGIREPDRLQIVLEWGSDPSDLDSHLVGPRLSGDGDFHTYYSNKTYFDYDKMKYVADLDYDDTTSYGPEITTIHDKYAGTYYFYVHDYSTGSNSESTAMGNSGATVKIYKDGSNMATESFEIKPGSHGTIWNVCKIVISSSGDVKITPINTYGITPTDESGNSITFEY